MIKLEPTPRIGSISKQDFIRNYKDKNVPVVLEQLTRDWPAREKWNLGYLGKVAGENRVPLYASRPARDRGHQHAPTATMKLQDYLDLLRDGENNLRMFFYNILSQAPELTRDFSYPDIGLKLFRKLPVLFMGGKGAKVQMHFDIDLADILLCHFGGRKRVYLFPPEQTKYLYRVPYSFSSLYHVDFENPNFEKYPALRYLEGTVSELTHGDVLYIPSGYWHYIVYEDTGFSMSLRAFPRKPEDIVRLVYNILVTRNIDGLMRKLVGQPWNDRNESRAVEITHKRLFLDTESGKL
jgi:hypothetical protein